jgi:hypothetical protein
MVRREITSLRRAEGAEKGSDCNGRAGFVRMKGTWDRRSAMTKRVKESPLSNFFFPDDVMYAPTDLKKYGYRLKRGEPYRLYSATEVRELVKAGKVVPLKTRPSKAKKAVEEVVPSQAPAKVTLSAKQPMTEEEIAAREEFYEREWAPGKIMDAIERWHLEPETTGRRKTKWKKQPMTLLDKEKVRRLFHKYIVTLEFRGARIVAVVQAKDNVPPLPPLEENETKLKLEWIKRRIAEAQARVAKKEVNC